MAISDFTYETHDVNNYPASYSGYYVSSQSKMWHEAGFTTTANYGVYRVRIKYPDSSSLLYGYSRNLLSFTGNTSALNSNPSDNEWKVVSGSPSGKVELTSEYSTGESGSQRTKFNFTESGLEFEQYIRTSIKQRHTDFRFTASVRAEAGEAFSFYVDFGDATVYRTVTGTGSWQFIDIPIAVTSTEDKLFVMGVANTSTTVELIEPMLAVDNSASGIYTWCPNTLDNYRHYPKNESFKNTYITETKMGYIDWVDNTHTPKVTATTTSYLITYHADCYTGNNATSETIETDTWVHVVAYSIPAVTKNAQTGELNAVAYRTDDQGDPDDEGLYFASEYDVTTSPVALTGGGNMVTYFRVAWRWYPNGSWNYDTSSPTQLAGTSAHITMFPGEQVDPVYAWEVSLEYKDDFVSDYTSINLIMVPDAYALLDFHYTGRGLSVGKISTTESVERGGLELALPVYLDDGFGFINADNASPTGITNPTVIGADDDMGIIMNKMSQMMANLRYMYTPKAVEVTQPSSLPTGVTSCSVNVVKCGFIVQVAVEFVLSATIANWAAVVTSGMPRQFGSSSIIVTASSFSTGSPRACRVSVGTSGNLQLRYGEAGTYRITFCYIANS